MNSSSNQHHHTDNDKKQNDFEESLKAEIDEIMKYKWYLGEKIHRDPLETQSIDDICKDWIVKHAQSFRKFWEERKKQKRID
jgi:hypothetical protein